MRRFGNSAARTALMPTARSIIYVWRTRSSLIGWIASSISAQLSRGLIRACYANGATSCRRAEFHATAVRQLGQSDPYAVASRFRRAPAPDPVMHLKLGQQVFVMERWQIAVC